MQGLCRAFGFAIALLGFGIGAAHADQRLKLAVGQPAIIELEANPSTGYGWTIDIGFVHRRPFETSVARRHQVEVEATAQ